MASPKSPKATEWPPLATPDIRPRITLRCLTRLGINMAYAPGQRLLHGGVGGLAARGPLGG